MSMTYPQDERTLATLEQLKEAIRTHNRIVVLSGAGISVPSGIPDFRSAHGLYSTKYGNFNAEEIISHDFFLSHVDVFYEFYKSKMLYPSAKPNAMHFLLARLEREGKISLVITQNIDGLHQEAGNKRVCELHGSVHRNHCERCGKFFDLNYITASTGIPVCDDCGGIIKPDVVLYGEMLNNKDLNNAVRALSQADMLIVIGTSLVVYPAAGLCEYFDGDTTAVINKSSTYMDAKADILINDDCALVAEWLDKNL